MSKALANERKDQNINWYFAIALFLFIFNIPLHILHLPFSSGKIITGVGLIYFLTIVFVKKGIVFKNIFYNYVIYVLGIVCFIFLINHVYYATSSMYYVTIPMFYIIEYLFGGYFLLKFFKVRSIGNLMNSLIVIGVIQACIMLCSLFIPPLKSMILAIMEADPQSSKFSGFATLQADDYFRGFALAADRTLGMSVFMSGVLMLLTVKIYNAARLHGYEIMLYCFSFLIISIGGLLAARTFFVGFALNLLLIFALVLKKTRNVGKTNLRRYFVNVVIIIIAAAILLPFVIRIFYPQLFDMFELAYEWAFEIFINLFQEGSIQTESSSDLMSNHLSVIPNDWKTIVIGDNNRTFVNGIHYMGQQTDSGYLRMLYVFGLLGSLPLYIFWMWVIRKTYKFNKSTDGMRYLMVLMSINLFVCQIKYDVFPGSSINFKVIVLLLIIGVLTHVNIKQRNENIISSPAIS